MIFNRYQSMHVHLLYDYCIMIVPFYYIKVFIAGTIAQYSKLKTYQVLLDVLSLMVLYNKPSTITRIIYELSSS